MSPPPNQEYPIQRVTSAELCKLFNDGHYWERAQDGEFRQVVIEERISTLLTSETSTIRSQMVSYRNFQGEEIARVHQFLRENGSIAASGRPDPKRLLENGILYRLEKKRKSVP